MWVIAPTINDISMFLHYFINSYNKRSLIASYIWNTCSWYMEGLACGPYLLYSVRYPICALLSKAGVRCTVIVLMYKGRRSFATWICVPTKMKVMHARESDETDHSDCFRLKNSVNTKNDEVREIGKHVENSYCTDADDNWQRKISTPFARNKQH